MDEIIQEKPVISSRDMEILSEFRYAGEIREMRIKFRLGTDGKFFIITGQSEVAEYDDPYEIPKDASEIVRKVRQGLIKKDFWSSDTFFDLRNFPAVLEKMKQIYKLSEPKPKEPNTFDVEGYGDRLTIGIYSVFPHNVGEPIVSLQLLNAREAKLDNYDFLDYDLWVSPETGEKMLGEMIRIEPEIKEKLNKLK